MSQKEENDHRMHPFYQKLTSFDVEQALFRLGGDYDLYLQILRSFKETFRSFPDTLQEIVETGENRRIQQELHTLKGVAANIEAEEISKQVKFLEGQLIKGKGTLAVKDVEQLKSAIKRSLQEIDSLDEAKEKHAEKKHTGEEPSKQELIAKLHELEKLFSNYDAGVRDILGQIKPGLIQMGLKAEVEKLERTAAIYAFDEAFIICEKILQMLEQISFPST